jgi:hypothetical protein
MADALNINLTRFWLRGFPIPEWEASSEPLFAREVGIATFDEDGLPMYRFKIGDGESAWRDLLWAGWGLADLDDLADGDVMQYDATRRCWVAAPPASGGGVTPALQFVAETGSTADSDPGAGLLKWNNATQSSATFVYLNDASDDGVTLTGIWPQLKSGGLLFLQHATDQDTWQIWQITSIVDATGYAKLGVTYLAGGAFADGDPMLVTIDSGRNAAADVAADTHAATSKATPVDADELPLVDSAASNALKKLTWANLKATLKTYFDNLYDFATVTHAATGKTTPVNADELAIVDSAASNVIKKLAWSDLKATLKTYFDTLYASVSGAGNYLLVNTATVVGSPGTVLTMSSLDLAADGTYKIEGSFTNTIASNIDVSLYFNGDTTAANYAFQVISADNTGSGFSRSTSSGVILTMNSSATVYFEMTLRRDLLGNPRTYSRNGRGGPTNPWLQLMHHVRNNTANVTSITLSAASANALGVGSYFKVFKVSG